MIGYLEGDFIKAEDGSFYVGVGGGGGRIGYEVTVPKADQEDAGRGHRAFWCRAVYRETSADLYGFSYISDRTFFDDVCKVKGFGPSTAMALIDEVGSMKARLAILANEAPGLVCKGIALKSARKLIDGWKGKS